MWGNDGLTRSRERPQTSWGSSTKRGTGPLNLENKRLGLNGLPIIHSRCGCSGHLLTARWRREKKRQGEHRDAEASEIPVAREPLPLHTHSYSDITRIILLRLRRKGNSSQCSDVTVMLGQAWLFQQAPKSWGCQERARYEWHLVPSQRDSGLTPIPPSPPQTRQVHSVTPHTTHTILPSVPWEQRKHFIHLQVPAFSHTMWHAVWSQLYDIPEKAKLWRQEKINGH